MKKPFKNIRGFIQAFRYRCYDVHWMRDDDRIFVDMYRDVPYDEFVTSIGSFIRGRVAYFKVTKLPALPGIYLVESRFMIDVVFY